MKFTEAAQREAGQAVLHDDLLKRPKIRGVTIDSKTSLDLDDSIWVQEFAGSGYLVDIGIADVAELVKRDSAIDREAFMRIETRYRFDGNDPMLPAGLSEDKLTLWPNRPRPVIAVRVRLDQNARVVDAGMAEAILTSEGKLSHERVDMDLLDSQGHFHEQLRLQQEVATKLFELRVSNGALAFYDFERKIYSDEEGRIKKYDGEFFHAQMIVQEMMILANQTVATWVSSHDGVAIFRNHRARPSAPGHQDLVSSIKDAVVSGKTSLLDAQMGMWFEKAKYDVKVIGHYGLNIAAYMHFTSPIRRYVDLINHRIVKAMLKEEKSPYSDTELSAYAAAINTWKLGLAQEKEDHMKQKMIEKRRDQAEMSAKSLSRMEDSSFSKILKQAVKDDALLPELEEALTNRFIQGKVLPFDLYQILIHASPKWSAVKDVALAYLKEYPHSAIMVLEIAGSRDGYSYEFVNEPTGKGQFCAWIKVTREGQATAVNRPSIKTQKKLANAKAAYRYLKAMVKGGIVPADQVDYTPVDREPFGKTKVESHPAIVENNTMPVIRVEKDPTQTAVASAATDLAVDDKVNHVGMVNEWCQSNGFNPPDFDFKSWGPSHMPQFKCVAKLKARSKLLVAEATAANKKAAKNIACRDLYAQIKLQGRGAPN